MEDPQIDRQESFYFFHEGLSKSMLRCREEIKVMNKKEGLTMKCLLCNDWIESLPKLRDLITFNQREEYSCLSCKNQFKKNFQKKDVKIVIRSYIERPVLIVNFG